MRLLGFGHNPLILHNVLLPFQSIMTENDPTGAGASKDKDRLQTDARKVRRTTPESKVAETIDRLSAQAGTGEGIVVAKNLNPRASRDFWDITDSSAAKARFDEFLEHGLSRRLGEASSMPAARRKSAAAVLKAPPLKSLVTATTSTAAKMLTEKSLRNVMAASSRATSGHKGSTSGPSKSDKGKGKQVAEDDEGDSSGSELIPLPWAILPHDREDPPPADSDSSSQPSESGRGDGLPLMCETCIGNLHLLPESVCESKAAGSTCSLCQTRRKKCLALLPELSGKAIDLREITARCVRKNEPKDSEARKQLEKGCKIFRSLCREARKPVNTSAGAPPAGISGADVRSLIGAIHGVRDEVRGMADLMRQHWNLPAPSRAAAPSTPIQQRGGASPAFPSLGNLKKRKSQDDTSPTSKRGRKDGGKDKG